jgi:hypothetical protein
MSANDLRDVVAWQLAHRLSLRIDLFLLSPDFRAHYRSAAALGDAARSGTRHIADGFARISRREYADCVRAAKAAQQRVIGHVIDAYDQRLIAHDELVLVDQLAKRSMKAANRLIQSLESAAPHSDVRNKKSNRRTNQTPQRRVPPAASVGAEVHGQQRAHAADDRRHGMARPRISDE